jgi:pimeloyl-ACP methyl ester carboxylesterase
MPTFTHDDRRLYYRERGSGDLLVIVPGNTASSACHEGELDHFGAQRRAVGLDLWGTGRSDRQERWPVDWWERAADDVAALIRHIGKGPAHVVGTSGGAIVALLAAALHPATVRSVVADSTIARFPLGQLHAEVAGRLQRTPEQIAFWYGAHGDDWEVVVDADSEFLLRFAEAGGDPFRGRLEYVACPVLFSASLADPSLPDAAAQVLSMVAQVSDGRAYLAGRGAHPLMWSAPDEFRAICDAFLATVVAGPHRL